MADIAAIPAMTGHLMAQKATRPVQCPELSNRGPTRDQGAIHVHHGALDCFGIPANDKIVGEMSGGSDA